jgi:predicted alpha/beta-fold hydrolase
VVRVNLRGCGSGRGLSKLPYNAGTSEDVKAVLVALKREQPESETILVGFSLGGNIVVKLAGELGESAERLLTKSIAVCPPLDLAKAVRLIEKKENRLYHSHYVKTISKQARCFSSQVVSSLYEFDDKITAPLWGYKSADAYYQDASGLGFLSKIQHPCSLLFAMDDPFVSFDFEREALSSNVQIYATQHGGHMGFLGKAKGHFYHWLDYQLLEWIL